MIIGFTGTRQGMTAEQRETLTDELTRKFVPRALNLFVHGAAEGADAEAHEIAVKLGYRIEIWPSNRGWKQRLKTPPNIVRPIKPPLDRNKDIVRVSEYMYGTPATAKELPRGGTWATIRAARRAHRILLIIDPDGKTRYA